MQHLRLHRPIARPTSLVQTILFFSAAIDIEIQYPRWSIADEDEVLVHPPRGSLGLTGTLHLRGFGERWQQFFALLSAQPLRFQKTRLIGCGFSTSIPTQSLLGAVSRSTRILHLVGFGNRESSYGLRRKLSLSQVLESLYSNIALKTFNVLEGLAFKMTHTGVCGTGLAELLDSISSPHFSILALDVGDRERHAVKTGDVLMKKLLDEVKVMDPPLCNLATRAFEGVGKRFTLILLGDNPTAFTRSFAGFHEVGNTWEGEKVVEDGRKETGNGRCDHYWTFRPARGCEAGAVDESVLSFVDV